MGDGSVCSEWPYYIWRMKDFFSLTRLTKSNCSVGEVDFNLILQQRCTTCFDSDYVELRLEKNDDKENRAFKFRTKTYMLNRKGDRVFNTDREHCFSSNSLVIWQVNRKCLLEDSENLKQENGSVLLICIFLPETRENIESQVVPKTIAEFKEVADGYCSLKALSRDFRKILNTSGTDLKLKYGNRLWNVHKHILSVRCPKFSEIFSKEANGPVEIPELSTKTFAIIVEYIYSGSLPEMDVGDVKRVYKFARRYEMKDLKDLCTDILLQVMTEENACKMLKFADTYKEESLKACIVSYIISKELFQQDAWDDFCESNPRLAIEVYQSITDDCVPINLRFDA